MTKQLSKKDAALWLCEAWGRDDIRPRHVRHVGNWLFHHDPEWYPEDVTCIHAPKSGDIWAEAWDDIPYADSPFGEKNPTKIAKTLATLDDEIANYIAKCRLVE